MEKWQTRQPRGRGTCPADDRRARARSSALANTAIGSAGTACLCASAVDVLAAARSRRRGGVRLGALGSVSVLAIMATSGQHRLGRADGFALFGWSTAVLFFIASLNGL